MAPKKVISKIEEERSEEDRQNSIDDDNMDTISKMDENLREMTENMREREKL